MKISDLLAWHDGEAHEQSLAANLGDPLLLAQNPWYSSARRAVLRCGYRFDAEPSEVGSLYRCFPLIALDALLEARTLPYQDNVTPLRRLLAAGRDFAAPAAYFFEGLHKNRLFHESGHAVAHAAFAGGLSTAQLVHDAPRELYRAALIGEACANSLELFGMAWSSEPRSALFLALNSYCSFNRTDAGAVAGVVAALGVEKSFELSLWAFLAAHLEPKLDAPSEGVLSALSELAGRGDERRCEAVAALARSAFALSRDFRQLTARLYFRFLGLADSDCSCPYSLLELASTRPERLLIQRLVREMTSLGGATESDLSKTRAGLLEARP